MSETSNTLAVEHNKAKEQFTYYLLGIDTVSLGFVIANNSTFVVSFDIISLAISIILLSFSFLSGLRSLDFRMRILGLNKDYLETFESIGKDNVAKIQDKIDKKFEKARKVIQFHSIAQGYLLIFGFVAYFAYLVLKNIYIIPC